MNNYNEWFRGNSEPEVSDDETIKLSLTEALGARLRLEIGTNSVGRSAKTLHEVKRLIFQLAKEYEVEFLEHHSSGGVYQGGEKKDLILLKDAVISFGIFTFENPRTGEKKTRIFLYPDRGKLYQEEASEYLGYLKGKLLSIVYKRNDRPSDQYPQQVELTREKAITAAPVERLRAAA